MSKNSSRFHPDTGRLAGQQLDNAGVLSPPGRQPSVARREVQEMDQAPSILTDVVERDERLIWWDRPKRGLVLRAARVRSRPGPVLAKVRHGHWTGAPAVPTFELISDAARVHAMIREAREKARQSLTNRAVSIGAVSGRCVHRPRREPDRMAGTAT